VVRGRLTTIRPARAEDADMLVAWHADPEVARYWDWEAYTRATMLAELAEPDVDPYIVEAEGRPVGFIQAWWERAGDAAGLDMFLVPDARGRGYGPDAARALAEHMLERGWARVTTDPYLWNERGVRGWRRAGFRDVEEREPDEHHTARWLSMEFQPEPG
jgi:aminoglycoside 6'-N-acetyltransferase